MSFFRETNSSRDTAEHEVQGFWFLSTSIQLARDTSLWLWEHPMQCPVIHCRRLKWLSVMFPNPNPCLTSRPIKGLGSLPLPKRTLPTSDAFLVGWMVDQGQSGT